MNTTSMIYSGEVDLKLKINGRIYEIDAHNSGTNYLKYLFAKVLVDPTSVTTSDTPCYIAIYKTSAEEEIALTTKDLPLTGKELVEPVETELSNRVYTAATFTGYISYDDIRETVSPASTDVYTMYLLSNESTTVSGQKTKKRLAAFKMSNLVLSYITPGITATVNWTLKLLNKNEEDA